MGQGDSPCPGEAGGVMAPVSGTASSSSREPQQGKPHAVVGTYRRDVTTLQDRVNYSL